MKNTKRMTNLHITHLLNLVLFSFACTLAIAACPAILASSAGSTLSGGFTEVNVDTVLLVVSVNLYIIVFN